MDFNKKIGILGGTFNPIHTGHINMALSALKECALDEVWFMPNGCPPHKTVSDTVSSISRYRMVEEAISVYDNFKVIDIELNSTEYNYTHETLEKLSRNYPDYKFFFLMGEDSLRTFESWKKPGLICKYASIIVAIRSDSHEDAALLVTKYSKQYTGEFILLKSEFIDVSSTELRDKFYDNPDVKPEYIDDNTFEYVNRHMVYEGVNTAGYTEIGDIKRDLVETLKPTRYEHTIGVMHTAINLGMRYDVPLILCQYAGLLHDVAKSFDNDGLIDYCKDNKLEILDSEYKAPHILHGKVGADIARKKYNITDERVLNAIINHTTGRPAMSLLEQIVFVADYIEPGRCKANRLNEIRAMAYYNIDIATAMILKDTINYLKDIDAFIDERTIDTYDYYK